MGVGVKGEGAVECCTVVLHAVSKHICCYGILVNTMLKSKVDEGFWFLVGRGSKGVRVEGKR